MTEVCRAVFFSNGDVLQVKRVDDLYDVQKTDRQDTLIEERSFTNPNDLDRMVKSSYGY